MALPPLNVVETIAAPGEVDLFEVDLIGGVDYTAAVFGASTGRTLPDPGIVVFDAAENPVAANDDSLALGLDPMVIFTAPATGTYVVAVGDVTDRTGDYRLVLDQAGEPFFFGSGPGEIA
jgi:hypothetical protein